MKFSELAMYLERLEGTASRNEMTKILAEVFGEASPEEARLIAYLAQGRLGPAYKSPDMQIADKMMIRALGEGAGELFKQKGDLGRVAEIMQSERARERESIRDVYEKLMGIARAEGQGSQEKKQELIRDLLKNLDGVSAKYVVKIILGKLRTGFSDMTMLDSLSWMLMGDKSKRREIEDCYNVRADLGEIAELVKRGKLARVEPEIGTPILMARCERVTTAEEIIKRNGECGIEYKLDGLRIQAHIKKSKVVLFSRGLEDVTSMYPDVVEGLQNQIKKDCVVEGEMIAVGARGEFLPFQETVQRKRKYEIEEMRNKVPLTIYLFDVLVVEGRSLIEQPNEKRREILERLVKEGNAVRLMPRKVVKSAEEIDEFFEKSLKDGTEGIIAKRLNGPYQAGARDFNWIKYKKSYTKSALSDTIDGVVMGYDVGQGKRTGFGIGDFLLGVYQPLGDKYLTVAKIGTGLTDKEWRTLQANIQALIVGSKPENYEVSKMMECDFWVRPKIVVEIQADEITKSPMHTTGYALRFPRLISWREKKPEDTTTVAEIENMFKLQKKGGDN